MCNPAPLLVTILLLNLLTFGLTVFSCLLFCSVLLEITTLLPVPYLVLFLCNPAPLLVTKLFLKFLVTTLLLPIFVLVLPNLEYVIFLDVPNDLLFKLLLTFDFFDEIPRE